MDRNREMGMEIEHAIEYGVLIGVCWCWCVAREREKQKRSTQEHKRPLPCCPSYLIVTYRLSLCVALRLVPWARLVISAGDYHVP